MHRDQKKIDLICCNLVKEIIKYVPQGLLTLKKLDQKLRCKRLSLKFGVNAAVYNDK